MTPHPCSRLRSAAWAARSVTAPVDGLTHDDHAPRAPDSDPHPAVLVASPAAVALECDPFPVAMPGLPKRRPVVRAVIHRGPDGEHDVLAAVPAEVHAADGDEIAVW